MRWLRSLPPALRAVVYTVAVAGVLVLAIGVGAMATLVYERGTGLLGRSEPQQSSSQDQQLTTQTKTSPQTTPRTPRIDAAEYLSSVGAIQNGSVETFVESHEGLLYYDILTPADVQAMEDNYLVLVGYGDRVADLDPPYEYRDQYEEFSFAISELYTAAAIAYRLAADPASATEVDFMAYDGHVEAATAALESSNDMLGENYRTTEGLSRVSLL